MAKLIVLFNLKPAADAAEYESWARTTDLPIVRNLSSVNSFDVFKVEGLFGNAAPAPYQYVEVIDIADLDVFGTEVATDVMRRVAGEFREFADNPVFMLSNELA
ncbi:MAG: REDY-like protein HapK [Gammaproteobacteria bacterium]|jgi:hypothetical protein|nr:REDY-like protein HapK [Gammaproteobacteria bacterium]